VASSYAIKTKRKRKLFATLDKLGPTPTPTISKSVDPPQHVAG